jgi:site-specific recombinase XerD
MVKQRRIVTPAERWRTSVEQLTLSDLAQYFEFHNRTEGKSPNTIQWYNEVLARLGRFLGEQGGSLLITDIGEPEVRAFIDHLQHKTKWSGTTYARPEPLSGEGIQNRVRALKAFFNWLHSEGYTDTNRLARLRNFKTERKLKEILTEDEIGAIFATFDVKTAAGARDAGILTLMLDSGLRLSEVVGLRLADADIDAGHLKVMGKGSKERIVPFGAAAQKALWRYRHHYRPETSSSDRFFLTIDGMAMTTAALVSLIKRVRTASGVSRLHPHLCRHTFATRYLINGGDVFSLQQILGHTTLEMVRKYVQLANAHVAVQHRRFSPMDHIALGQRRTRPRTSTKPA